MCWDIEVFLEMKIVDLIPDAFFSARDNKSFYPVCRAIIQAIATFSIHIRFLLCIAEWNGDLSELTFFRDVENRLLIICFNRLNPAGVSVPIVDLIPCAVERISLLTVFLYTGDL